MAETNASPSISTYVKSVALKAYALSSNVVTVLGWATGTSLPGEPWKTLTVVVATRLVVIPSSTTKVIIRSVVSGLFCELSYVTVDKTDKYSATVPEPLIVKVLAL